MLASCDGPGITDSRLSGISSVGSSGPRGARSAVFASEFSDPAPGFGVSPGLGWAGSGLDEKRFTHARLEIKRSSSGGVAGRIGRQLGRPWIFVLIGTAPAAPIGFSGHVSGLGSEIQLENAVTARIWRIVTFPKTRSLVPV